MIIIGVLLVLASLASANLGIIDLDTLVAHNSRRQLHQSTPALIWNDCLFNCASAWAKRGLYEHNGNRSSRCSECGLEGGVGENVAIGYNSILQVMDGFYDAEAVYWDYAQNRSFGANNTEHMTQIVWVSTIYVACAINTTGGLVICNYSPCGNNEGEYGKNIRPLKVPTESPTTAVPTTAAPTESLGPSAMPTAPTETHGPTSVPTTSTPTAIPTGPYLVEKLSFDALITINGVLNVTASFFGDSITSTTVIVKTVADALDVDVSCVTVEEVSATALLTRRRQLQSDDAPETVYTKVLTTVDPRDFLARDLQPNDFTGIYNHLAGLLNVSIVSGLATDSMRALAREANDTTLVSANISFDNFTVGQMNLLRFGATSDEKTPRMNTSTQIILGILLAVVVVCAVYFSCLYLHYSRGNKGGEGEDMFAAANAGAGAGVSAGGGGASADADAATQFASPMERGQQAGRQNFSDFTAAAGSDGASVAAEASSPLSAEAEAENENENEEEEAEEEEGEEEGTEEKAYVQVGEGEGEEEGEEEANEVVVSGISRSSSSDTHPSLFGED